MALELLHQTKAQFAARFWERVKRAQETGDQWLRARLVWWIWARIQAGDLTSDQVRLSYNAYFGKSLTTAQWNTLVTTRLVPIKDRYLAMLEEADL